MDRVRGYAEHGHRRYIYAAEFPKKYHITSWNSKGYLTWFMKLQKFPQIPVPTLEEC